MLTGLTAQRALQLPPLTPSPHPYFVRFYLYLCESVCLCVSTCDVFHAHSPPPFSQHTNVIRYFPLRALQLPPLPPSPPPYCFGSTCILVRACACGCQPAMCFTHTPLLLVFSTQMRSPVLRYGPSHSPPRPGCASRPSFSLYVSSVTSRSCSNVPLHAFPFLSTHT